MSSASTGGAPAQRTQSLNWSKAGNVYMRFNEADVEDGGSGMAEWLRLKKVTHEKQFRREREGRVCAVCLGTDRETAEKREWSVASCSHHFHAKCIEAWKMFQKLQGRDSDCPMCRLALH